MQCSYDTKGSTCLRKHCDVSSNMDNRQYCKHFLWIDSLRVYWVTFGSLSKAKVDDSKNVIVLAKCVLIIILQLNWCVRFEDKKKNKSLTSSLQLQNRSFHVVESTTRSAKCRTMKNGTYKACKSHG